MPRGVSTNRSQSEGAAESSSGRVALMGATTTPLKFYALCVLGIEGLLTVVAANAEGLNQLLMICGMMLVLALLISFVGWHISKNQGMLFGSSGDRTAVHKFCSEIAGPWWESVEPDDGYSAVGFVDIAVDGLTDTMRVNGRSFTRAGCYIATWDSQTTHVDPQRKEVLYIWTGNHIGGKNDAYQGFGKMVFRDDLKAATGWFFNLKDADPTETTKKTIRLNRRPPEHKDGEGKERDKELVENYLRQFGPRPLSHPPSTAAAPA